MLHANSTERPDTVRGGASGFQLSKWYLDCVAADGTAFIGYSAAMQWLGLSVHYAGTLLAAPGAALATAATVRRTAPPVARGDELCWDAPAVGVAGTWRRTGPAVAALLHEDAAGRKVEWACTHPRADVRVEIAGHGVVEGLGYVEHLTLTVPPWQLPMTELHWGRFLTPADTVAWIQWRGPLPQTRVFHNGAGVTNPTIEADAVAWPGHTLALPAARRRIIREGPVVPSAIAGLPGLRRLLPRSIRDTREAKWVTRGELSAGDAPASAGWAIHEVVRWG